MKRRTFLHAVGGSVALGPTCLFSSNRDQQNSIASLLLSWTPANDKAITHSLDHQQRQANHPYEGGFADRHGIYRIGAAAHGCALLMTGYLNPSSIHHQSDKVADAMVRAVGFLLRMQHGDGTIDLVTTNFHSPPDTGFIVEPMAVALSALNQLAPDALSEYRDASSTFLLNAGRALQSGGVHTPNHRWVVSMALSWLHTLFPNPAFVKRIDEWLAEQIDIDPDGQYTERSVAAYTPLVNRCLITIARLLDRPALLEPVRRNLTMTQYYVRANGELVTASSRRQDQYTIAKATSYYYPYRFMALHDQDGRFAAMARMIEDTSGLEALADNQLLFFEDESLCQALPVSVAVPDNYVQQFTYSDLVRIRRKSVDATILSNNTTMFSFFNGNAGLQAVRLASAFFGRGQFQSPTVRAEGPTKFVLRQSLRAAYYQPIPRDRIPSDGRWSVMPRSQRAQSEIQTLESTVTINEEQGRFTLTIRMDGTERVPVAVELAFRHGGRLSGVRKVEGDKETYLLDTGKFGTFEVGGDRIRFGPGRAEHSWTQLRGANPKLDAQCVYLTGHTPFETTFSIESS